MAQWRIKEISDMTKVSIRMLRHYDKIGLLKPSYRSENQYRWYTEQDLARLQQIIALKYFGFGLKAIKSMMQKEHTIQAHLQAQQLMLNEQAVRLHEVHDALTQILQHLPPSGIPDWNELVTLIERYHMTEKLKKSWAGQSLSPSQFEEYVAIYEQYPKEFAKWDETIEQINKGELGDPESPEGMRVAKFVQDMAKKTQDIASKQRHLNADVMRDIKAGKLSKFPMTPEGNQWLTKACLAYGLNRWEKLYDDIVANLKSDPTGPKGKKTAKAWVELVYGNFSPGILALAFGTMTWQELARQHAEIKEIKTPQTPQDLVSKVHIKLAFNPEAMSWIERALCAHLDQ